MTTNFPKVIPEIKKVNKIPRWSTNYYGSIVQLDVTGILTNITTMQRAKEWNMISLYIEERQSAALSHKSLIDMLALQTLQFLLYES